MGQLTEEFQKENCQLIHRQWMNQAETKGFILNLEVLQQKHLKSLLNLVDQKEISKDHLIVQTSKLKSVTELIEYVKTNPECVFRSTEQ